MNFNMNFPSFKGCKVIQVEEREGSVIVHVEMKRKTHQCPRWGRKTTQIYDYRYQKIKHLKWFERNTEIFYKRRRYRCACGKRFSESNPIVERYQRTSIEWNQAVAVRAIKGKTFKEVGENYETSATTK